MIPPLRHIQAAHRYFALFRGNAYGLSICLFAFVSMFQFGVRAQDVQSPKDVAEPQKKITPEEIKNRERAEELFEQGMVFVRGEEFQKAIQPFSTSLKLWKDSPPAIFNLARAYQVTGECVKAVPLFSSYINLPQHPKITPESRDRARSYRENCRRSMSLFFIVAPAQAIVKLDGVKQTWRAGEAVWLGPGESHSFSIEHNRKKVTKKVNTVMGVETKIYLDESQERANLNDAVSNAGTSRVDAVDTEVKGQQVSPGNVLPPKPTPPKVVQDGPSPVATKALVKKDGKLAIETWNPLKIAVTASLGALGLGGIVAGAVMRSSASGDFSSFGQSDSSCYGEGASSIRCQTLDDAKTRSQLGNVFLFSGGAFVLGAVVTSFVWKVGDESERTNEPKFVSGPPPHSHLHSLPLSDGGRLSLSYNSPKARAEADGDLLSKHETLVKKDSAFHVKLTPVVGLASIGLFGRF